MQASLDTVMFAQCEKMVHVVRSEILESLARQLNNKRLDENILSAYPFLRDARSFLDKYTECFSVKYDTALRSVSLWIDRKALAQRGLPSDLPVMLEFGYGGLPPMPHIRPVMDSIGRLSNRIAGGLWLS